MKDKILYTVEENHAKKKEYETPVIITLNFSENVMFICGSGSDGGGSCTGNS